jgi:hypothetical protein
MAPDDLKTLANCMLRADGEAGMYRLVAPLTADETEPIAQLVEKGCDEGVGRVRTGQRSAGERTDLG